MVPAVPNAAASFRVSMAAIDPDETPEFEDGDSSKPARATLKIVRAPPGLDMDDDEESDDEDYEDVEDDEDEEDSDDEEVNGGPSDKEKARKLKQLAAQKELLEAMEEDGESDDEDDSGFDLKAAISKLIKGKGPAMDDESDDESEEGLDLDESVICTLNAEQTFQQPLDITICEGERVFFKATGNYTIYLTGNYVISLDEANDQDRDDYDEDDEDEYDLSPDEDELDLDEIMAMNDDESDDLDGMEDPRITEVESEEEAPKLVEAKKGKNKRAAEEESLDDMIAKGAKKAEKAEPTLTKAQQKKLKKNNGDAAAVEAKKEERKKEAKTDKKVQFAKNLEQGPTPSGDKPTGTLGVKEVRGVKIDDKKLGKGTAARSGNTVAMRYIGKLEDGKVFDSNKKGKPFSFKLGKGEVIKGWDIGIAGMAPGGERRITIPANLAYGKKALPGIPANSKLIFDVKLLEIK
jgi:FK506-binding nuclear protein